MLNEDGALSLTIGMPLRITNNSYIGATIDLGMQSQVLGMLDIYIFIQTIICRAQAIVIFIKRIS